MGGSSPMAGQPSWNEDEPPKDKQVLALAFAKAIKSGSVNLVRVVAAWVESNQEWRPVKVGGDTIAGTDLDVVCWAELPEVPDMVGRLKGANPSRPTQVYPRLKSQ
jgi:hypothetical protein